MHHTYHVSITYRGQAVGYHKGRTVTHQSVKSLLHKLLALRIKSRCSLVKDKYRRILQYRTRYRYALALSARKLAPAITDIRLIAILSLHYEIMGIRYPGSLYHLLHRGVLHTESDIIVEGVIE